MERLHSKTVLITGATGFIAKLLVEKILRLQPGIKRVYLLVRAGDEATARRRVQSEVRFFFLTTVHEYYLFLELRVLFRPYVDSHTATVQ
ncbi:hypothetical protein PR202_ga31379 [Eleusine coracana subsp. coracana]|uniref:Fatty acyl-CoA reductase n=1 Tax=Eleusine coracana subsp. coracana TaxID=191504 RepID=A0AAV5DS23_ELECO|nr:hypothetical protein PR202_ga31379 [Eleusine coracana subsp. coracana]